MWKNCTPDFEYFSMFIYFYQVQSFMVTPSITHNIIVTCHFSWGCSMLLTVIFHGVSPKEMTNEHTLERKCWQIHMSNSQRPKNVPTADFWELTNFTSRFWTFSIDNSFTCNVPPLLDIGIVYSQSINAWKQILMGKQENIYQFRFWFIFFNMEKVVVPGHMTIQWEVINWRFGAKYEILHHSSPFFFFFFTCAISRICVFYFIVLSCCLQSDI